METALARVRRAHPATLLFAGATFASGAVLLHYLSRLTFWRDEWGFLLDRRGSGLGVFLDPFVEQLLAMPVLIYKVLVSAFGMESPLPFQLASVGLFLLSVVLLFVYVRRRVGPWLALAVALPILFLGQAWDDLLFPFQMSFFGSMSCGLGALLALDRDDRPGDILAAALLTVCLFFSDLGIPFVAGITLEIALRKDRLRRAYIVAIPTAVWAIWYLGWGHTATNFVSFQNFATLPGYIPDGFASSLSSLLGLGAPRDEMAITPLDWGRPLLVVAVGLAAWRLSTIASIPRHLWTVLAIGTAFFFLTGLNAAFFGQADSGRYQYIGAILIILIAAELVRGIAFSRLATGIALAVGLLAALSNFSTLRDAANGLAGIAQQERGGLAALELTRGKVGPEFMLTEANSGVDYINLLQAGPYFSAIDAYGSPAYTPAGLATSTETARISADMVFAAALGIHLSPMPPAAGGRCASVKHEPATRVITVPRGRTVLRGTRGAVDLKLRRYASLFFPVDLGSVAAGQSRLLEIPADRSSEPWELRISGRGSLSVCSPAGG